MLKALKKLWKTKGQILEGFRNSWIRKPEIEKIAFERLEVCNHCENIDKEGSKCMVPGTAPCCGVCGCKLGYMTRSLSAQCSHPDGPKWTAWMTEEEQDAYYKKINYNPDQE